MTALCKKMSLLSLLQLVWQVGALSIWWCPAFGESSSVPGIDPAAGSAVEIEAPPRIRLRGAAKELSIEQGTDEFENSIPGSLTFQHDLKNDTETHTADVFFGYRIPVDLAGQANIIPYFGLVKSKHEANGLLDDEHSTDQRKLGISADIFFRSSASLFGMATGYRFIGLLERSSDNIDKTRFSTASISVKPYIWHLQRKPFPFNQDFFYVQPLLLLRLEAINYSRRSNFSALALQQENARRIGGEVGIAVTKRDNRLSYSFRYLKLHDWKGHADASHASHAIDIGLDQNGYANVVLRFDRGVREDQFEPERLTSLLFALRY